MSRVISTESADQPSSRLPSGRHNLPREFVVRSQRDRLLDSMAQACAEKRYAEVSVADIVSRARHRVSPGPNRSSWGSKPA